MDEPKIITYQLHLEDFTFLGNPNIIDQNSDFGAIWDGFFQKGGYGPILPYAVDKSPTNIWFHDEEGRDVYFQGLFVKNVGHVPEGYTLMDFPGGDYLAVTTEWMETNEEAVGPAGNGRCNGYAEHVPAPEGYVRADGPGSLIYEIEKEYANTPQGSRYEVWVPIQKV
ncbi:AraC family transcriptional regulator [Acutalibacter sp. 1XD8-33]|uniref:effector binding domain-containing protein n=1 Tax=Acutalibacter sp. 1XD8-33 TaxID=2320081 RepID=UPI000EA228D2|nr:effector binding domain-containing protein [Acutalibacter sp. 1XD8-33]RKJ40512.1 AraC family transcriptional regulator [Acutalibacter sp. 1XD8-33]